MLHGSPPLWPVALRLASVFVDMPPTARSTLRTHLQMLGAPERTRYAFNASIMRSSIWPNVKGCTVLAKGQCSYPRGAMAKPDVLPNRSDLTGTRPEYVGWTWAWGMSL